MRTRTISIVSGTVAMIAALQIILPSVAEAQQRPSATCYSERTRCLQGNAQRGPQGQQYVPPDAAARCHAAYRQCMSGR